MERGCHGVGACHDTESLCRDSVALWSAFGIRIRIGQGEFSLYEGLCEEFITQYHGANTFSQTTPKQAKKVKTSLDSAYSYLGGNAFGRDKKGKITKDDAALSSEMAAAGMGGEGNEYTAYVYYEFEFP